MPRVKGPLLRPFEGEAGWPILNPHIFGSNERGGHHIVARPEALPMPWATLLGREAPPHARGRHEPRVLPARAGPHAARARPHRHRNPASLRLARCLRARAGRRSAQLPHHLGRRQAALGRPLRRHHRGRHLHQLPRPLVEGETRQTAPGRRWLRGHARPPAPARRQHLGEDGRARHRPGDHRGARQRARPGGPRAVRPGRSAAELPRAQLPRARPAHRSVPVHAPERQNGRGASVVREGEDLADRRAREE